LLPETGGVTPPAGMPGATALAGFGLAILGLAIGAVFALRPGR
jgi:hypothetical protein